MAPHADLDSGQLLDQPARLPPGADEPRPDLSDAVLRVRKVFDIEDLEVCVLVQETESPILREAAGHCLDDVPRLEGKDRILSVRLVNRELARRRFYQYPPTSRVLHAMFLCPHRSDYAADSRLV